MSRLTVTLALLAAASLPAQTTYLISSLAGVQAVDLTLAPSGDVYFSDPNNGRIQKMDPAGVITTVASEAGGQIAVDSQSNIYLLVPATTSGPAVVRKIDPSGRVSTVVGSAGTGYNGDNIPAAGAALYNPSDIAVDAAGNLYIADAGNARVRRIGADGMITTFAGTGVYGDTGDGGLATAARLEYPQVLWVDPLGNVYIADSQSHSIRKVTPGGIISTAFTDKSQNDNILGLAVDAGGTLYLSLDWPNSIVTVTPDGTMTKIAGLLSAPAQDGDGGPALNARLGGPRRIALLPGGVILFVDFGKVRKLEPGASIFPLATVNAASQTSQPLSPGELVTLYWSGLGTPPATVALGAIDPLPTELAGVRVLINDVPAPLLYVDSQQINALVPTTLAGVETVTVQASYQGKTSNRIEMPFQAASPGIFVMADAQYHVVYQVDRGSELLIFGTGAGPMTPWPGDGRVSAGAGTINGPVEALLVRVWPLGTSTDEVPLTVDYAGPAPSLLAGVFQMNVKIPDATPADTYYLTVRIAGQSTRQYLTVR